MAKRRMFSSEITTSDSFLEMSLSAQALYFHLGMYADDDGVVNNFKTIVRTIGAKEDDLKLLVFKRFIIPIEDAGIIVIKHWKINNYIQKDRYTPSKYHKDLKILGFDDNGAYVLKEISLFDGQEPECIQVGYTDKDRKDKESIDKSSKELDKNSIDESSQSNDKQELGTTPNDINDVEVNDDDLPF